MKKYYIIFPALFLAFVWSALTINTTAQNIVDNDEPDFTLPPIKLGIEDLRKVINTLPPKDANLNLLNNKFNLGHPDKNPTHGTNENFRLSQVRVQKIILKLENHIRNMMTNLPLMPFHHTLGISGYEVYFNHPDELFYSLSIAIPFLPEDLVQSVKKYLEQQADVFPPYSLDGYDNKSGKPRESYDVPMNLRVQGRGKAIDTFGVYSFWTWCYFTDNTNAAKLHWKTIKDRMRLLLSSEYKFNISKTDYSHDEAEHLNGDLAGLIGYIRLARVNNDEVAITNAEAKAVELLNLRVNLERVNPKIVNRTSATKSLHVYKLARYCRLVPEIAVALKMYDGGCAAKRISAYRSIRNGWYMAFGDRFIGGENYTNPLHFGRALFCSTALIENLPSDTLASFVDVPHCIGDLYFIEKCVLVLRSFAE